MSLWRSTWLAALLAIAAASADAEQTDRSSSRTPLVVYAAADSVASLGPLLERFTTETGIRTHIVAGTAAEHARALIEATDSPRADVFLSDNVQAIWHAAEEGGLRPHGSPGVALNIPAALRDADGLWTAVWQLDARLFVDRRRLDLQSVEGFEYLADENVAGQLCLSRFALPLNRAVIAYLIEHHERRPAELIVRGWVKNLALPPFETEGELVAALAAGKCGLGIVSSAAGAPIVPGFVQQPLASITPVPRVSNAVAAGVSRHATSPDSARRLIEWLLSERVQSSYPASLGYRPVIGTDTTSSDRPLSIAGWLDEEAVKLAERARYR